MIRVGFFEGCLLSQQTAIFSLYLHLYLKSLKGPDQGVVRVGFFEGRLLSRQTAIFSLYLHLVLSLCRSVSQTPLLTRTPVILEWDSLERPRFSFFIKSPIPKYSHILRQSGLGLQNMNFERGHNSAHNRLV